MINRATLTGRLTRDVDLRYTPNGTAVGNFTLAVDRTFTNRNGDRDADFINCVIWRKAAENFSNFTHKGSLVGIDGRIQTRNYENKNGQRVFVTEIVVENFALLEPRNSNSNNSNQAPQSNGNNPFGSSNNSNGNNNQNNGNNNPNQSNGSGNNSNNNGKNKDPFANSSDQINISDDDLPF